MKFFLITIIPLLFAMSKIQSQGFVIDHNSIKSFDKIPDAYKDAASKLRMIFMDRSVGGNIDTYLDCLHSPWSSARSYCKRFDHRDSIFAVDPSEVYWSGMWDRSNWRYEYWPATCSEDVNCFIDFITPRIDSFDVMGCQFSYLAVIPGSKIADTVNGFFGSKTGKNHANVYANFQSLHPDKKLIWWTTSLARGIGTAESQDFNDQMRNYASKNNIVLFDVADIESHDPGGKPCFDNRDGIPYLAENNPDDGLDIPAICPQYTTETEGGHLGSISAGGIRIAKAFWVLMAKLAGWNEVSTATKDQDESFISLYPNPVNENLNIELNKDWKNQNLKISIKDIAGKILISKSISDNLLLKNNTVSIQTGTLNSGIYTLTIYSTDATIIKNFIILK